MSNGQGVIILGGPGSGSQGASGGAGASYGGGIGRITWRQQPAIIPWTGEDGVKGQTTDWKPVMLPVSVPLYKMEILLNGVLMSSVAMGAEDIPITDVQTRCRYPSESYLETPLSAQEQKNIAQSFGDDATIEQKTITVVQGGALVERYIYIITRTIRIPFYSASSLQTQANMMLRFSLDTPGRLQLLWGGIIVRDWDIAGL